MTDPSNRLEQHTTIVPYPLPLINARYVEGDTHIGKRGTTMKYAPKKHHYEIGKYMLFGAYLY